MTSTTEDQTGWQPMLPGFDGDGQVGPMETAARATLAALHDMDLMAVEHQALEALVLTTARDIDRTPGLGIAKANSRSLIADLLDRLPAPVEATDDQWSALERDLAALADT